MNFAGDTNKVFFLCLITSKRRPEKRRERSGGFLEDSSFRLAAKKKCPLGGGGKSYGKFMSPVFFFTYLSETSKEERDLCYFCDLAVCVHGRYIAKQKLRESVCCLCVCPHVLNYSIAMFAGWNKASSPPFSRAKTGTLPSTPSPLHPHLPFVVYAQSKAKGFWPPLPSPPSLRKFMCT